MRASLVKVVRERAGDRCEYCHLPASQFVVNFSFDHVIACFHGGKTRLNAYACLRCNAKKNCNLAGLDTRTNRLTRLFNPRVHRWEFHFRWKGPQLMGRTAIGRTTVRVLALNDPDLVELRRELIAEGVLPEAS